LAGDALVSHRRKIFSASSTFVFCDLGGVHSLYRGKVLFFRYSRSGVPLRLFTTLSTERTFWVTVIVFLKAGPSFLCTISHNLSLPLRWFFHSQAPFRLCQVIFTLFPFDRMVLSSDLTPSPSVFFFDFEPPFHDFDSPARSERSPSFFRYAFPAIFPGGGLQPFFFFSARS